MSMDDLFPNMILRIAKWASSRRAIENFRHDDVMHNWEATISCGPQRVRM